MSNDEWLLNQIGTPTYLLSFVPDDIKISAEKRTNLAHITGDVLAHLLSFTNRQDFKNIIRVCRAWYNATRQKHYWSSNIARRRKHLIAMNEKKYPGDSLVKARFKAFDPFMSPLEDESLRDKLWWTFLKNYSAQITYNVRKHGENSITRHNKFDESQTKHIFESGTSKITSIAWFRNGDTKVKYYGDTKLKLYTRIGVNEYSSIIKWIDDDGTIYEGQGLIQNKVSHEHYCPHGNGTWKFPDGSVIEGKGVAWKGEPRLPIGRETKRIKIADE